MDAPFVAKTIVGLSVVWTFVGCSDPAEPINAVRGTVTYNDQPVTGGTITFDVATPQGPEPYVGMIDEQGRYEILGIPAGDAFISLETDTQMGLPTYVQIPATYNHPSTSGLTFQIQDGESEHDISLK